jgi:hypothetical protein
MTNRPNYEGMREKAGFRWYVNGAYYSYFALTGIPIEEVNVNPDAMIELHRKGRPLFKEMWGEDVGAPGLSTPAISYGHINALGADLVFPEGGEVNYTRFCDTLDDAIEAVSKPVDWANAGRIPFYLEFREKVREAFPGENVGFSMSVQGPITTAYCLRDLHLFTDIYDEPERTKVFLEKVTESELAYRHWQSDMAGQPRVNPNSHKLYDDVGSMFSVPMWEEYVIPVYEQHFQGLTTGRRSAHIEDLRPEHLYLLEVMGLSDFDPGISHKLNPVALSRECRVPFGWRMGGFHYDGLTLKEVEDWVYQAAADGAGYVFSTVEESMCRGDKTEKVKTFMEAAKRVENALQEGATREEIGSWVSEAGKERFWDHWPE